MLKSTIVFRYLFFLLCMAMCTTTLLASPVDSLQAQIASGKEDTMQVKRYMQLGKQFDYFQSKDRIRYFVEALQLSKKLNYNSGIKEAYKTLVINLQHRTMYDLSYAFCKEYMQYLKQVNDTNSLTDIYNVYANLVSKQGKNKEALEHYHIYRERQLAKKEFYGYANALINIGILHLNTNELDSAFVYTLRAYDEYKKLNKASEKANAELVMAEIAMKRKENSQAMDWARRSYNTYSTINLDLGIMNAALVLSQIQLNTTHVNEARTLLESVGTRLSKIHIPSMKRDYYYWLAKCFETSGSYEKAYLNYQNYKAYNDSVSAEIMNARSMELDVKYDLVTKEQQLKDTLNEKETARLQRNWLLLLIFLALCVIVVAVNAYRLKRKSAEVISEQKKIIEEKQHEVLDSITYASKIQKALLAHSEMITKFLPENFVVYEPRDIVSGDFYWATSADNDRLFYLAVCDSTGHGVPGAFMSLLNINFMNEAINEKHIHEPGKVFDFVRERLKTHIGRDGQRDGFDGILVCVDRINNHVTYAAANNAPLIVTNTEFVSCETDKMPVGLGIRKEPFRTFTLHGVKGDTVYLFTDGLADQFGGPEFRSGGKKFKLKNLKELLLKNSQLPMDEQRQRVQNAFYDWKGELDQVDDVCLIGFRL